MTYYNSWYRTPCYVWIHSCRIASIDTSLTEAGMLQSNQMVMCLVLAISRLESWVKMTPRK
jgi:hypothetical protein